TVTTHQLVAPLPTDAKLLAQRRHALIALQKRRHKPNRLVQNTGLLEWHRQTPPLPTRKPVNDVSGLFCKRCIRFGPTRSLSRAPLLTERGQTGTPAAGSSAWGRRPCCG